MKKLILFILLSKTDWLLVESLTCPTTDENKGKCSLENKCENKNHFCLMFSSKDTGYCCDMREKHCVETNMIGFPDFNGFVVVRKVVPTDYKNYWYEKAIGHDDYLCPKPISWQLVDPEHTAVGYDKGKPLRECSKNKDCKKGEFCGDTLNLSFRNRHGKMTNGKNEFEAPFANDFLDMSDNGKSILFCYKVPKEIKDSEYKMERNAIGFSVCNEKSDCGVNLDAKCKKSDKVRGYFYFEDDGKPTEIDDQMNPKTSYEGVCLYKDGIATKTEDPPPEDPAPEDPATEDPATEDLAPESAVEATYEQPKSAGSTVFSMLMMKLVLLVFYLTQ